MIEIPVKNGIRAFPTKLVSMGKSSFTVLTPIEKENVFRVKPDQEVKIHFSKDGTHYRLQTKCIQSISGEKPVLRLELDGSIEIVQRREFFRVAAAMPIRLEILSPRESGRIINEGRYMTCDISGGGISISGVPTWVSVDMPVRVEIPRTSGLRPVRCSGIVVRSILPEGMDKNTIAIEFTDISEKDRDRVIELVFKLEIEGYQPDDS